MNARNQTVELLADQLQEMNDEEPHWITRGAFSILVGVLAMVEIAMATALYHGWIWVVVPLVAIASHLMHGSLIGFHEASHSNLRKSRWLNDLDGVLLGTLGFMSFTLYRVVHQTHHAYLITERDLEFWPFNDTEKPRWFRCLAAAAELNFGMFFTPILFLETFLCKDSIVRSPRIRRKIWSEFSIIVFAWGAIITVTTLLGLWKYLIWMYLVPAFIGANLQSWRKYIEHVGMTGTTATGATRSIVADNFVGRVVSFSLLHEPLHGIHHQRAGLTHAELSRHVGDLQPRRPDERPPFPSYGHALLDLVRCLRDPRVGPHWSGTEKPSSTFCKSSQGGTFESEA